MEALIICILIFAAVFCFLKAGQGFYRDFKDIMDRWLKR